MMIEGLNDMGLRYVGFCESGWKEVEPIPVAPPVSSVYWVNWSFPIRRPCQFMIIHTIELVIGTFAYEY